MTHTNLQKYQCLKDCFNKGKFDDFYQYLAPDVIRTSMWYEDIVGYQAVLTYYKTKETEMAENVHYHASLAKLVNSNKENTKFPANVSGNSFEVRNFETPQHITKLTLAYQEGEIVILLKDDIFSVEDVLVCLDFNPSGLISAIHLSDPKLYVYEEIIDSAELNSVQLSELAIAYVDKYYKDLGYTTNRIPFELDLFPHIHIKKGNEYHQIIVYADHYPFYGAKNKEIKEFFALGSYCSKISIKFVHVQVEGLGIYKHYIQHSDKTHCHIKKIEDAYVKYKNTKENA
jgi:hypothetical protein